MKEAIRLGIPVFGIVDTNADPNIVDFAIPANDDATKSIEVILDACCAAIAEGVAERKVEKAANDEKNEDNKRARQARAEKSEAEKA